MKKHTDYIRYSHLGNALLVLLLIAILASAVGFWLDRFTPAPESMYRVTCRNGIIGNIYGDFTEIDLVDSCNDSLATSTTGTAN